MLGFTSIAIILIILFAFIFIVSTCRPCEPWAGVPLANFISHGLIHAPWREVPVTSVCLLREMTMDSDQGEIPL